MIGEIKNNEKNGEEMDKRDGDRNKLWRWTGGIEKKDKGNNWKHEERYEESKGDGARRMEMVERSPEDGHGK